MTRAEWDRVCDEECIVRDDAVRWLLAVRQMGMDAANELYPEG